MSEANRIFVVYGEKPKIKDEVCDVVKSIGYEPLILENENNHSDTNIEKIERY